MSKKPNAIARARSLHDLYESAALLWPDTKITFMESGTVLTYAQLVERAKRVAGSLLARGVERGELIGFVQANDPEFLLSFLGISLAGGVPTPLPLPASATGIPAFIQRLQSIVVDAGMRRVLVSSFLSDQLAHLGGHFDLLNRIEALTCTTLEAEDGRFTQPPVSSSDLGLVQYTSGSTSAPKGVALRHRHVLAAIEAIGQGIQINSSDVNGQWLPLFHDMGLIGALTGIAHGTPHFLWQPTTFIRHPERWLRAYAASGASIYAGPNFSYSYMIDTTPADEVRSLDLSRWRVAFNGAESIDPREMDRFARHFAPAGFRRTTMFPVYGLAEATLAVTFPALGEEPKTLWVDRHALSDRGEVVQVPEGAPGGRGVVCVGAPIAGHEVQIRGPEGPLGEQRVGEIEVRGPAVMDSYYDRTGKVAGQTKSGGWLATGDLGFRVDGQLYVTGRIKQMLIVRGQNFYPEDIEWAIKPIEGVYKGRSVAVLDGEPGGDDTISVIAETALATPKSLEDLAHRVLRMVRDQIGIRIDRVLLVRERSIRRTTNGKYQRVLMGELLRRGELQNEILYDAGLVQYEPPEGDHEKLRDL